VCSTFRLENSGSIFNGLQEYADESRQHAEPSHTINLVIGTVKTIQCGTALCELGFSVMNIIITKIRTTFHILCFCHSVCQF